MEDKLHLICFSPTGTTRTILTAIAEGFEGRQCIRHDLTRSPSPGIHHLTDGTAIIGVPVYAGRVPVICLKRLAGFSADSVPAVLVVLYGNREYEDALVELRDVATASGFSVVAAGAFVGEHSYSTADVPIAAGRPDAGDLEVATRFGSDVARRLASGEVQEVPEIPGNVPYRERPPSGGVAPTTDATRCTLCGTCASVCPPFAIDMSPAPTTNVEECVLCCACTRSCPEQARVMLHPRVQERRETLARNCARRKEPVLFP